MGLVPIHVRRFFFVPQSSGILNDVAAGFGWLMLMNVSITSLTAALHPLTDSFGPSVVFQGYS